MFNFLFLHLYKKPTNETTADETRVSTMCVNFKPTLYYNCNLLVFSFNWEIITMNPVEMYLFNVYSLSAEFNIDIPAFL